jgi:hypothetical protein
MLQMKLREKMKTHFIFNNSSYENRPAYDKIWKIMVNPYSPQIEIQYGACAMHAGYLRPQTHCQNM